jgi:hypothetical protein
MNHKSAKEEILDCSMVTGGTAVSAVQGTHERKTPGELAISPLYSLQHGRDAHATGEHRAPQSSSRLGGKFIVTKLEP